MPATIDDMIALTALCHALVAKLDRLEPISTAELHLAQYSNLAQYSKGSNGCISANTLSNPTSSHP